jgi:hypothetical protein
LAVERVPALHSVGIHCGDLVRNRHVGVEVRIASASSIPVGECGADEPCCVELGDAVGASAGSAADCSMNASTSATAASWASSIPRDTDSAATAHNADTLLTGLNVKS